MKFIFSILTLSILFFSCASTQKNNDVCGDVRTPANAEQCAVLFPQKQTSLNSKSQIAEATDAEILKYMDALVIEHLKISTSNQHGIDLSLKQALETVEKTLKEIFQKDPKYREIYKQKFSEKLKDYNKNSKSKDKEKRDEDETKRKIIEDSFPEAFNQAKQKIIFHQIKPGKFMMGSNNYGVKTTIDKPFSLMSTEFTQMMWARLQIAMGETNLNKINPSINKTGDDSIKVDIEGIVVDLKPEHPVENVNWRDVSEFVIKLNDLSKLDDIKIQNLLIKLISDHQKNDVYDLPTAEQWEFVMRDRGDVNKLYFDKSDNSEMSKYAWQNENSENQTHAVAQLLPRMIDAGYGARLPFYDMEGNVWEWTKNSNSSGHGRTAKGNSYTGSSALPSNFNMDFEWHSSSRYVGFRLARTNR